MNIFLTTFDSPLGPMTACASNDGICLLEFSDRRMLKTELKTIEKLLNASVVQGENNYFSMLKNELREYFKGERKEFNVPLTSPGTEFQRKVWCELMNIPYGATRSYKQQAIALGNKEAVRAVANANGMNRIAIIIPCHRVIGDNGHLTGYGGGLWRKRWLLDLENKFSGIDNKNRQQVINFAE
jgi:AraC family transcriptional regulator of adaptative response/methylated-DNA-[protein]-cysteine methyltransferase